MSETIEQICLKKGVKLTDQRKIIAKVLSESKENYGESDHPDVDELYNRVSKIDSKISIATVYRTVKLFEEAGILTKHDFKGGKSDNEAKEIIEDFLGMIKENPELKNKILKEDDKTKLMCLSGVKQYPMRVKCATLSWHTLVSAMENDGKQVSTED